MGREVVFTSKARALMILAVVGFGLLQGSRLLDQGSGPYSSQPHVLAGIVAGGACCILLALLAYFANLNDVRPVFAAGLALMAARISITLLPGASDALMLLSQVAAGIGWMLVLLCWMQVFVSYRPVFAVPMIAVGYIIDLATVPLTNALFPDAKQFVFLAAFSFSVVALGTCLACNRSVASAMLDDGPPNSPMKELAARTGLILFAIFAISTPCGFIIQADILGDLQYAQAELTASIGIGASLALLVPLVIFRPGKRAIDLAYPVSVVCLVLVLGYRVVSPGDAYAAGSLMSAFLMTFFGVFWITFVREAHERRLPAFFLLGLAVGVAQLSLAIGRLLAFALQGSIVMHDEPTLVACAASFLAIAACGVVTLGLARRTRAEGRVPLDAPDARGLPDAHGSASRPVDGSLEASGELHAVVSYAALDLLRDTYSLSKREFQVVTEYSTGRTARYVADELMLSEHTVKSHLRRAYAKAGVHSRQELLSLVEDMEAEVHSRYRGDSGPSLSKYCER